MIEREYVVHHIVMLTEYYEDEGTSKRAPGFGLYFDGDLLKYFRITTKFDEKPEAIKRRYLEIFDYLEAGLKEKSWIDTVEIRAIYEERAALQLVGALSDRDLERIKQYTLDVISGLNPAAREY